MRNIVRYAIKAVYFANSTTVWGAHFNLKTIESITAKGQRDLFYVSLQANINKEHPNLITK